ncbi:MAG: hypothetical protein RL701_5540, partial [Pseudomonadota bacterium]
MRISGTLAARGYGTRTRQCATTPHRGEAIPLGTG